MMDHPPAGHQEIDDSWRRPPRHGSTGRSWAMESAQPGWHRVMNSGQAAAGPTVGALGRARPGASGSRCEMKPARHAFSRRAVCPDRDRKSTRLNSSHVKISYAVFCLKKKNADGPTLGEIATEGNRTRQEVEAALHQMQRRGLVVFFFNDTATTEIYTLSLHDALPIPESCLP